MRGGKQNEICFSVIRDLKEYHVEHNKTDFQQICQFEFLGEMEEFSSRNQNLPNKVRVKCLEFEEEIKYLY